MEFELHRLFEPGEDANAVAQVRQLAMRDGDARADAGRAEPFPLEQNVVDVYGIQPRQIRGAV